MKALTGYLGIDKVAWRAYDAYALIEDDARLCDPLVDQVMAANYHETQLKSELLEAVCTRAAIPLTLRWQSGYDHSYYFIASFIDDHLR